MTGQQSKVTSRLGAVRRGRIETGKRITIYGPEAVGKTQFAADSPDPIFIDTEDGSAELDVARYSFDDGPQGHVPKTYEDVVLAIDDLIENEHEFGTLAIDTIDALEPMIWDFCCRRDSGKSSALNKGGKKLISVESYGYGRGYVVALDIWRSLASKLDRLRVERNMNIILLSHSHVKAYKNPEGEDFDRYQIRVHEKAAGFIKEWSDIVGYACFEGTSEKLNDDDMKAKGISTGRRMLMLDYTAAYDAKSRIPLPPEVELEADHPWKPIGDAIAAGSLATPETLAKDIKAELARIGDDELGKNVMGAIKKAGGDVAVLLRYRNNLRRR